MEINRTLLLDGVSCVTDFLHGLATQHPGLAVLPKYGVVIRKDLSSLRGKVALIAGGGSGHEPADAGFVGKGMLTASISGAVFTSPPPKAILAAIQAVNTVKVSGILLLLKNYTGDRLNFGLAMERAKVCGIKNISIHSVGEDIALIPPGPAGKRGLAGAILVWKIAGAMAENGKTLHEILEVLNKLPDHMGTIGLSLWPGTPRFDHKIVSGNPGDAELGLGIHGEAGVGKVITSKAKDSVKILVERFVTSTQLLLTDLSSVVLVNNLGGLGPLELGVVTNEVNQQLTGKGLDVQLLLSGTVTTSLTTPGFSVSVLNMPDNALLDLLLQPTASPDWPQTVRNLSRTLISFDHIEEKLNFNNSLHSLGPTLSDKGTVALKKILLCVATALSNCEQQINSLDTGCGDGDCGTTLKRGCVAVLNWLPTIKHELKPHYVLLHLAMIAENEMGGTSGALYALLFAAGAKSFSECVEINHEAWTNALKNGIASICEHGKANVGDRTMLDALVPVLNAMENNNTLEGLAVATRAAELGALETRNMVAHAGRASYVSGDLLKNSDPGAHAVGIWMGAVFEAVNVSNLYDS